MDYLSTLRDSGQYAASVIVKFNTNGLTVNDFEIVENFSNVQTYAQFYAVIKYYFLLAVEHGELTQYFISISSSFIADVKDAMKCNGYMVQERSAGSGEPAHPVEDVDKGLPRVQNNTK